MTEEKKKIEEAVSIILRGIDIESSALILEKVVMDNYIISVGRVNILRVATRQILNFIEDYKNKDYLKVIKEKVKANEEVTKLQKENEEKDKYIKNSENITNEMCNDINKLLLEIKNRDKQIDLMAKKIYDAYFEQVDFWIWFETAIEKNLEKDYCESIKQYVKKQVKEEGN